MRTAIISRLNQGAPGSTSYMCPSSFVLSKVSKVTIKKIIACCSVFSWAGGTPTAYTKELSITIGDASFIKNVPDEETIMGGTVQAKPMIVLPETQIDTNIFIAPNDTIIFTALIMLPAATTDDIEIYSTIIVDYEETDLI